MIRRDYASARLPGPVKRRAPGAPRRSALHACGLALGFAASVFAGWLLLGLHTRTAAQPHAQAVGAAATPEKAVTPPPRQRSQYDFYRLLTSAKATSGQSVEVASTGVHTPKQP